MGNDRAFAPGMEGLEGRRLSSTLSIGRETALVEQMAGINTSGVIANVPERSLGEALRDADKIRAPKVDYTLPETTPAPQRGTGTAHGPGKPVSPIAPRVPVPPAPGTAGAGGATAARANGLLKGATAAPMAAIPTAVEVYCQELEDKVDKKERQGEAVARGAAGIAAGGVAAGLTAVALGTGAGAVVTVGAPIAVALGVGYVASEAVSGANNAIDQYAYGAQDARFRANIEQKPHMIGMAATRFHSQLADPATGQIDWGSIETVNRYSGLLRAHIEKQDGIVRDSSSFLKRWMRGDEDVVRQQAAQTEIQIAEAAQTELEEHIRGLQEQTRQQKFVASVDAALNNTGVNKGGSSFNLDDLDRDGNGTLTTVDLASIKTALQKTGIDEKQMNGFIKGLQAQGITFTDVEDHTPPALTPEQREGIKPPSR